MAKRSKPRVSKVKEKTKTKSQNKKASNIKDAPLVAQSVMPPHYDNSDGKECKFLLVGWGSALPNSIPKQFQEKNWTAERLDYVEQVKPDHKGYMVDMNMIEDNSVDVLWCPYILQRFYDPHMVKALDEAYRVMREDGVFYTVVPDGQLAAAYIANDRGEEVILKSPTGIGITAYDLVYGHRTPLSEGKAHFANRSLFSVAKLGKVIQAAGFSNVSIVRRGHELHLSAYKQSFDNPKYVEKIVTSTDVKRAIKSPPAPKVKATSASANQLNNGQVAGKMKDELDVPPVQWKK